MADDMRTALEPLLREVLGRRLRALRLARGERLVETAARAGVSPQYLSEIERGLKEPSSEMIAAISGALETTLVDLTAGVAHDLRADVRSVQPLPVAPATFAAPSTLAAPSFELYAVAA